jgi:RND family efflux transporter MFP subunit
MLVVGVAPERSSLRAGLSAGGGGKLSRLLASVVFLFAVNAGSPASAQQAAGGPPPVTVANPVIKPVTEWDEYTGRFEAVERVEIRSRVSGFLDSNHFQDGQLIEKGDLLFVIDPRPFEAEVLQAQAEIERATAELEFASKELERGEQLAKSSTISRAQTDTRRSARSVAAASLKSARGALQLAELDLAYTQIKAPISGRISNSRVDVGNLVNGGTTQSTLLTTIVSIDPIYFVFDTSEADYLKYLRLKQQGTRASFREAKNPVFVRLMDETEWTRKGVMNFVDNELGPGSGTIRGRAIFDNPQGIITPGLFGRLRLVGSDEYMATLVPDSAVLSDQSNKIVMTVDGEGTVVPKFVTLGPVVDGLRVIRSGLSPDDQVVIEGIMRARPGGKVTPEMANIEPEISAAATPSTASVQ